MQHGGVNGKGDSAAPAAAEPHHGSFVCMAAPVAPGCAVAFFQEKSPWRSSRRAPAAHIPRGVYGSQRVPVPRREKMSEARDNASKCTATGMGAGKRGDVKAHHRMDAELAAAPQPQKQAQTKTPPDEGGLVDAATAAAAAAAAAAADAAAAAAANAAAIVEAAAEAAAAEEAARLQKEAEERARVEAEATMINRISTGAPIFLRRNKRAKLKRYLTAEEACGLRVGDRLRIQWEDPGSDWDGSWYNARVRMCFARNTSRKKSSPSSWYKLDFQGFELEQPSTWFDLRMYAERKSVILLPEAAQGSAASREVTPGQRARTSAGAHPDGNGDGSITGETGNASDATTSSSLEMAESKQEKVIMGAINHRVDPTGVRTRTT